MAFWVEGRLEWSPQMDVSASVVRDRRWSIGRGDTGGTGSYERKQRRNKRHGTFM